MIIYVYIYIYTHPNTIQEDQRSESLLIKDEQAAAPESAGTGQGLHGMIYGDIWYVYMVNTYQLNLSYIGTMSIMSMIEFQIPILQ